MAEDDDVDVFSHPTGARRMNRRIIVTVVAAALALPAAGSAATTAVRTGSFDAMGTGTLAVQGNLRVFGTLTGTMLVRDRVGGAVVRIAGVRKRPKLTINAGKTIRVYTLRRVDASFYAKGTDIRVELRSPKATVSMSAFGRGRVLRLFGEGTYHLNGGVEEQWSSAVVPFAIKPPPPERPPPPVTPSVAIAGIRP